MAEVHVVNKREYACKKKAIFHFGVSLAVIVC
jgi:hypothetical protein